MHFTVLCKVYRAAGGCDCEAIAGLRAVYRQTVKCDVLAGPLEVCTCFPSSGYPSLQSKKNFEKDQQRSRRRNLQFSDNLNSKHTEPTTSEPPCDSLPKTKESLKSNTETFEASVRM